MNLGLRGLFGLSSRAQQQGFRRIGGLLQQQQQRNLSSLTGGSKSLGGGVHSLTSLTAMSRAQRFGPMITPVAPVYSTTDLQLSPQQQQVVVQQKKAPTVSNFSPTLLRQQSLFEMSRGATGNDLASVICGLRGYSTESSEMTSDGESEEEMLEVNIPCEKEMEARKSPDLIDEDWIDRNEPDLFDNEQTGRWILRRERWIAEQEAKARAAEGLEADAETEGSPEAALDAAAEEEAEEPEPQHQEEIERFLKRFGEEDHADKFPDWNALMTYRSTKLKKLEIPMKSRRMIRKQVELFKQALILHGFSPKYPPWERVTLEEARSRSFQMQTETTMARVEARRDARLKKAKALEEELEEIHNPKPLSPEEIERMEREMQKPIPQNVVFTEPPPPERIPREPDPPQEDRRPWTLM